MKKKYLLIKLFFIMMISFLILASIVIPSVAEESKVDNENITVELPEVIETTDIRNLLRSAPDITVVDVTGLILGKETQHEHIWKTMYDENLHWNECMACGEKQEEITHTYTTTWAAGSESCLQNNYYTKTCSCGYSFTGHKPCVWDGSSYYIDGVQHMHIKKCKVCGTYIRWLYYLNTYGSGNLYQQPEIIQEPCHTTDGIALTCSNTGTCAICKNVYGSGQMHALFLKEPIDGKETIYCIMCNKEFGRVTETLTTNSVAPATITTIIELELTNGAVFQTTGGYRNENGLWASNTQTIISGAAGSTNVTLKTVGTFTSNRRVGYKAFVDCRIKINGISTIFTNQSYTNPRWYYPDPIEPTITDIRSDDSSLIEWSKTKPITISGTENYCNTVTVEILDDEENSIFKGETTVTNGNYSISCTPEIEAGLNGRTFTAIVTDACNNSTTQEFIIRKVDAVAPHVISGTEVMGDWAKEKEFTFEAIDNGIGNVSIAFNNVEDYELANKLENTYSRDYKFVGDVYEPTQARVFYKDELGNIRTQTITIDKIDNTAPAITNARLNNNKLVITANDRHEMLGEGSGVSKYRFVASKNKLAVPVVSKNDSTEVAVNEELIIPNINEMKYVYVVAEDAAGNVSEVYEFEIPELELTTEVNLTAANGKGGVDLDWSTYDAENKIFKVYQKKEDQEEWESISTVDFYKEIESIKVLNVYPQPNSSCSIPTVTFRYLDGTSENLPKSAALKVWIEGGTMTEGTTTTNFEAYGKNPITGQQIIKITPVSNDDFNSNPDILWNYDIVMIGTWDANGYAYNSLSDASIEQIECYIKRGYGILIGHDTLTYTPSELRMGVLRRLRTYFNIEIGNNSYNNPEIVTSERDYNTNWAYMSSTVIVNKNCLLTNFPYELPLGTKLTIPQTHTLSQAALGNVWMTLIDGNEITEYGHLNNYYNAGGTGNPCYYLTTWNNTAMIQTGHSNAESTADERKVLANTLFYLKQRTKGTGFTDNSAQDLKAPNAPIISTEGVKEVNKIKINYNAVDNGSTYSYYVEAFDDIDNSLLLATSNQRTETITTGTKGYYYIIDTDSENKEFDVSTATYIEDESILVDLLNNGKYIHIKAIDIAGNVGEPAVLKIEVRSKSEINLDGGTLDGNPEPELKPELVGTTIDLGTPQKEGYTFDRWEVTEGEINGTEYTFGLENGEIIAKWIKNHYDYTVEYYYNEIKDNEKTETLSAEFESIVEEYTEKPKVGYKFSKIENVPLKITTNPANNIIKVYYVTDDSQVKNLSYTVEYYKEGIKVDEDTQTVSQTVQLLEDDILTVKKAQINITDKYYGYKLLELKNNNNAITKLPDTVENGDVIKVYYVIDESQTKELSYTVEYYISGLKQDKDTQIVRNTVQVLEEDTLMVDKTKINTVNKYYGYKLDKTMPEQVPDIVNNGYVIKVYYVIDEDQTKEVSYTVQYFKDSIRVPEDTQVVKQNIQVLDEEILAVNKNQINRVDKYYGYKFERTDPQVLPNTVETGTVIKVYYVTDDEQTKNLNYKVEYYQEDEKVEEDTQIERKTVQVLEPDTLTVNKSKINIVDKYVGYELGHIELNGKVVSSLPNTVNNNDLINIYYVIDESQTKNISYTVEYYKENRKVEEDTQIVKKRVQVLQPDILDVDKSKINIVDKYLGYRLDRIDPVEIPSTIENGGVIKVYYMIDDENTKNIKYTVEYYQNDVKVEEDTQVVRKTVQILDSDTLKVNKSEINIVDKYIGYKLDYMKQDNRTIAVLPDSVQTETVIKIYYVTDENQTKNLSYTVEYYKNDVKVEEDTQIVRKTVQVLEEDTLVVDKSQINIVNKYLGYRLENLKKNNSDIVELPNVVTNWDIIKVYYEIDENQTKEISYTVEYYQNDIKVEEDTQVVKNTVQVLKPDTLKVDKSSINTVDKYIGYKLEKLKTNENIIDHLAEEVTNGDVIKVYYVIDESQTKNLDYTVEYYKEGIKVEDDTQVITQTVQILQPDILTVDKSSINTEDKYYGYKLEGIKQNEIEISELPDTVTNKTILQVYYVIDENQTKDLSYTVEYYKEGIKVEEDTQVVTQTVQVLEPDVLTVDKSQINTKDKYSGYKLEKIDPVEIPEMIENSGIIKVYYTKDSFEYTVEYYYDGVIDEAKTDKFTAIFQDEITIYEDKNITGYKLEKEENLPLVVTEYPAMNIIKVYYVKWEFDYTVNYYYDGVLDEENTETKVATFGDLIDSYIDKVKDGYRLETVENIPLRVVDDPSKNIINVYYVRKDANVVVKYVDKETEEEISDEVIKTGKVFDEFDVAEDVKEVEGYTLIESPEPTRGNYTEEEQIFTYYYAKNTQVVVKYIEKDLNNDNTEDNDVEENAREVVLAEKTIIEGHEGKAYETSAKEIENYTLVEDSKNTTGTMTRDEIIVVYYYLQNTKVTVKHIDKNSGEVLEVIEQKGLVGDTYTSTSKDFEEYVGVQKPENETVVMTKDEIILEYYYEKISAGVIEKHIDVKTDEILDSIVYEGNEGTPYKTEAKEFEGYDLVEEMYPENSEGTMTVDVIEVKYYYVRKASVRVEYIDKITGEKLPVDIEIAKRLAEGTTEYIYGHEGDLYETEEKKFEGYDLIEVPENSKGEMTVIRKEDGEVETEIIVEYYYVRKAEVKVEYIDIVTGEKLPVDMEISEALGKDTTEYIYGHEGDLYETEEKKFEGYDLVEVPENYEGEMTKEQITVTYKYIRKTNVIVEYIDIITGEKILEQEKAVNGNSYVKKDSTEIIEGHEGDSYKTIEKEFAYYELVQRPENSEGTMIVTIKDDGTASVTTYVRYYYAHKSSGVVEKHIDIMTNKEIAEDKLYEGNEGDPYKTSSKEIDGYELLEEKLPENAEGKMKKEVIEVKYYYKKVEQPAPEPEPQPTPEPVKPNDNNNNNNGNPPIIRNIYNYIIEGSGSKGNVSSNGNSSGSGSGSTNKNAITKLLTPGTGDILPQIAMVVISGVILMNIIVVQIRKSKKQNKK